VECAVREAAEETGLVLRNGAGAGPLAQPHPFTAADVIVRAADGHIQYHYAIVEVDLLVQAVRRPCGCFGVPYACSAKARATPQVAATPEDARQAPRAAADADAAKWFTVAELEDAPGSSWALSI